MRKGIIMKTIQISAKKLQRIDRYIGWMRRTKNLKLTRAQMIARSIYLFSNCISEEVLNKDYKPLHTVGVRFEDKVFDQLKEAKVKYRQPMYVILSACVDIYMDNLLNYLKHPNVAIIQFKKYGKNYAFYYDAATLPLQKNDWVEVEVMYQGEKRIHSGKVRAFAFEEKAKETRQPILRKKGE